MIRACLLALVVLVSACGTDDSTATVDAGSDATPGMDAASNNTSDASVVDMGSTPDASDTGMDASPGLPVIAENYCELTAESFCDYYLRCGRMAVADKATCLGVFAEQCNGVYEPHYRALEAKGMLELSEGGLQQCQSHLATVACEKQMFDLDGGCAQMWVGKVPDQGPCGPGIESFACQPSATCVISLNLCGVCEAAVGVGAACGPEIARCDDGFQCVAGSCVKRADVGDACSDTAPCRIGASCVAGTCQGFNVVALGDACGQGARCPYNSFCRGGLCVAQKGLGESCAPDDSCRSGVCELGMCQPLRADGEVCNSNPQCVSGRCDQGICGDLPGACFEQ